MKEFNSKEEYINYYVKDNDFSYRFLRFLLYPIGRILFRMRFKHQENIPKEGPIILACNHRHKLDPVFLCAATKRTVRFMAWHTYFDGPFHFFFSMAQTLPVYENNVDHAVTEAAAKILERNEVIGIFPEGKRNFDSSIKLLPIKHGAVNLSQRCNAQIVPCFMTGGYSLFSKITVSFGEPFTVSKDMDLDTANEILTSKMLKLAEEEL